MDNIYQGAHSYNVYYDDRYGAARSNTAFVIRANSEHEATEKFKTQVDAGKNGAKVVNVVKIS